MNTYSFRRFVPRRGLAQLFWVVAASGACAQGVVNFNNNVEFQTMRERLIRWPDGSGLTGTNYVAQLYYGANADSLTALTNAPARFRPHTTTSPGTWLGGNRTLWGFSPGAVVTLEVRVWDSRQGETFEQAQSIGGFALRTLAFTYTIPPPNSDFSAYFMENFWGATWLSCPYFPPPIIHVQPTNEDLTLGGSATLRVVSEYPCFNQWLHNGAPLVGGRSSTLTLTNVQYTNAGLYSVIVSTRMASVTSDVAVVSVNGTLWGTVNFNNQVLPAPPDRLVRTGDGTPLVGTNYVAQLYYGSAAHKLQAHTANPAPFRAPTTAQPGTWSGGNRTLSGLTPGSLGVLAVRVWDGALAATYEQAVATAVPHWDSGPFVYRVPEPGLSPTNYYMYGFDPGRALVAPCPSDAPPAILSQPQSRVVAAGSSVTFTSHVSGACLVQWRENEYNVVSLGPTLTLDNVQPTLGTRQYRFIAENYAGCVTSAVATLTVIVPPQLNSLTRAGDQFGFYVPGEAGRAWRVETATNVQPPVIWTPVETRIAPFWHTNVITPADRQRFFRAVLAQ